MLQSAILSNYYRNTNTRMLMLMETKDNDYQMTINEDRCK